MFANRSPTLSNWSLLSASGNGFREAETGGAETRKPLTSAKPETQDLRTRRAKSLNPRAVWQSVQETRWEQNAWWCRQPTPNPSPPQNSLQNRGLQVVTGTCPQNSLLVRAGNFHRLARQPGSDKIALLGCELPGPNYAQSPRVELSGQTFSATAARGTPRLPRQ